MAALRLLPVCLCLVLVASGSGSASVWQAPAPASAATNPASPLPTEPVAPYIQALLDTTAAGSQRAADEQRGLQAGAALRAFYGPNCAPAWGPAPDSLNIGAALALLARAAEHGLSPADYRLGQLLALRDSLGRARHPAAARQARLDVYLSDAVLAFMRDLRRGRLRPYTVSGGERAAGPTGQPGAVLRAALAGHNVPAALLASQPANREYRQLQQALAQWLAAPVLPDSAARHQTQYELVALNLERWRWDGIPEPEYILINLPAYELEVIARDSVQRRHRVVIGKPETPTPTLSSRLSHFTLAPDWHVPHSIATREILPRLKKDPGYLYRNNYRLTDAQGRGRNPWHINWATVTKENFSYTIRQSACCDNALGNIVFRFANPYSIYVHDTPARALFKASRRALSHGCIRLQNPMLLAAYLLRREGRPVQLPTEDECARMPRSRDVRLSRPLPLYVRYATCTAENGQLRFLADVYHRDEPLRQALFGLRP
ncbi:L,D-transpeptidase family protein [Hymenobacter artigasi]|uniref:Murein L,D-transpeptidase YcbB/YkuD n=1 Tax=Hymenobacter artigasi TaxID=2719616 RepID=A0ABX1HMV8_9BACT|nr:L,D-transpeptidase family protein [Hymenobacter artigasi]NKI90276.1 murein L,D-transpeptidase YcbB/YkuD [Hymenobacter artigasi]